MFWPRLYTTWRLCCGPLWVPKREREGREAERERGREGGEGRGGEGERERDETDRQTDRQRERERQTERERERQREREASRSKRLLSPSTVLGRSVVGGTLSLYRRRFAGHNPHLPRPAKAAKRHGMEWGGRRGADALEVGDEVLHNVS